MDVSKMVLIFFIGFMASVYCTTDVPKSGSIYDFVLNDYNHRPVSLSKYRGSVLLIINYARICGFGYLSMDSLVEIAKGYEGQSFKVLMIPSNSFNQNFGWNDDKAKNLAAMGFEVFEEGSVTGNGIMPLYEYLTSCIKGTITNGIKWNFTKFLVDRNGKVVERYSPFSFASTITKRIDGLLKSNDN